MDTNYDKLNNLAYNYYDYLNSLYFKMKDNKYTTEKPKEKKGLFKRKQSPELYKLPEELVDLYNQFINNIQSDNKSDVALLFKDFALFLKNMERCFLYNNDISNSVYSEINENKQTYELILDCDTFSIKYKFDVSAINMPKNASEPFAFIDSNADKKVIFITVTIKRNFGSNNKDEFKFIQGSAPVLYNKSDIILYDNIINTSRKIIIDTIFDILDNNVCDLSMMKEKVSAEDVFNNGSIKLWNR